MENFVFQRMAVSGICVCVCVPYIHIPESTGTIFQTRLDKVMMAKVINDEENVCGFKGPVRKDGDTHDLRGWKGCQCFCSG